MARARQIKPGFFINEDIVELPFQTRLLFIGLWTLADRRGILDDRPKKIKMALFPADNVDVEQCLSELASFNFIERYEVAGMRYIHISEFVKHQHCHKDEKPNNMPAPSWMNDAGQAQEPVKNDGEQALPSGNNDCDLVSTPDEPGASTVPAPDEPGAKPPCSFQSFNPVANSFNPKTHTENLEAVGELTPGQVCVFLTSQGVLHTNPAHMDLLEALRGGAVLSDFAYAATEARQKQKGFAYLLKIAIGNVEKRKNANSSGSSQSPGKKLSLVERAERDCELARQLELEESGGRAEIVVN